MAKQKYWDGSKWVQVAPSMEEFTTHKTDDTSHVRFGIATAANTKIVTLNPPPAALVEGYALSFKNLTQNTGAVTLNINGLGAKPVVKSNGNALTSGSLKAGSIYTVRYSGSSFILQGEGGEYGTATATDVLRGRTIGTDTGIIEGTIPDRGVFNLPLGSNVPGGYYSGGTVPAGRRWASGKASPVSYRIIINNLDFTPRVVIATSTLNNTPKYKTVYADLGDTGVNINSNDSVSFSSGVNMVFPGGFEVYGYGSSSIYDWIAYE